MVVHRERNLTALTLRTMTLENDGADTVGLLDGHRVSRSSYHRLLGAGFADLTDVTRLVKVSLGPAV